MLRGVESGQTAEIGGGGGGDGQYFGEDGDGQRVQGTLKIDDACVGRATTMR